MWESFIRKSSDDDIIKELKKILEPNNRKLLLHKYDLLEEKLGGIGASEKTAKLIVADTKKL